MSTYKVENNSRTLHSKCTITVKLSTSCSGSFTLLYLVLQTIHTKCIITVELYIQSVQLLSNSTYRLWWWLHAVVICPVCSHWCRPMDLTIPYRYVNNNYTKKHWSVFWSRCWRLNKAAMKRFLASYYKIITSKLLFVVDEFNRISCQYFLLLKSIRFST